LYSSKKLENYYEKFDHEIIDSYVFDLTQYHKKKLFYDNKIKEVYNKYDSIITKSNFDNESKLYNYAVLFQSTFNKIQRLESVSLEKWIVGELFNKINTDCDMELTTYMYELILNLSTKKIINKFKYQDLEIFFNNSKQIKCSKHKQGVQRICLLKMFENEHKLAKSQIYLDSYVSQNMDSIFF
jgi:hypothetical protein